MKLARLEALRKYQLLDTPPDGAFDRITELAALIFDVPIAIVSLVDKDRIWFKSKYGLSVNEISRDPGLCASAILSDDIYVIENAERDPRSLSNPLVAGSFGLRFYAASPLQTSDYYNLGTLCIIDKEPRHLNETQKTILRKLGSLVMDEMDKKILLRNTLDDIKSLTRDLSQNLKTMKNNLNDKSIPNLSEYLEASTLFLSNIEHQLNQV